MDAIDMCTSHMYDWCMPIDVEEEVISALGSPKGREILAEVFETVLERRARQAASPMVGLVEAARMLGVAVKTDRQAAHVVHERCRRDDALRALKSKIGGRSVMDRAGLEAYIQQRKEQGNV